MIYLNNAATSLQRPPEVAEAVAEAMTRGSSASRGVSRDALHAARTVYCLREKIADFMGYSEASRAVFTSNATEALNTAILGLFRKEDHVISTELEHNSVLRPLERLRNDRGIFVDYVKADILGQIDYAAFEALIRPDTRAIITTHVSNVTGNVVDLEKIALICRRHGLIYIVDAAQSAGSIPIHMEKMGIDVLCYTGHKGLMGPQGTGGLIVREGIDIRPLKEGGTGIHSFDERQPVSYPEHLEAGTLNIHGLAGLGAALDFIERTGIEEIHQKEMRLTEFFYGEVSRMKGVTVYGDWSPGHNHASIVTLNFAGVTAAEAADLLDIEYGISVRAGAHCAPKMHRALGTSKSGAVRFSFGYYNTQEEAEAAVRAVSAIAKLTNP